MEVAKKVCSVFFFSFEYINNVAAIVPHSVTKMNNECGGSCQNNKTNRLPEEEQIRCRSTQGVENEFQNAHVHSRRKAKNHVGDRKEQIEKSNITQNINSLSENAQKCKIYQT